MGYIARPFSKTNTKNWYFGEHKNKNVWKVK
jgi:hypothetical protein